jgi:hypothetical protein
MKFEAIEPPREFKVGSRDEITLKDCGRIQLEPNEQVTLVTDSGTEFDVARKSWGYYATPSLNRRLQRFNLRGALARGQGGETYFLLLVERGHEDEFNEYLTTTGMNLVCWLDSDSALKSLEQLLDHET